MRNKKFLIICLFLLVILIVGVRHILTLKDSTKQLLKDAIIVVHRADGISETPNPLSPDCQKIVERTSHVINNSVLVPAQRQIKVTLELEPATFSKDMDESDYIEIKTNQPFQIPGQREESKYNKARFILSGRYEGVILMGLSTQPSKYGVGWHSWAARDEKEFWSLREFLDLPPKQITTPALHEETAPLE